MIWKLMIPAIAGIALGVFIGQRVERAAWADRMSGLEEEHRAELAAERREGREKIELANEEHQRTVDRYKEIIEQERSSAERARRIAARREERINEINEEMEAVAERFSGRSHCQWDGDDIRLWNETAEAINRGIRQGVPGAPEADRP